MSEFSPHALRVLEYERVREVLSSYAVSVLGKGLALGMEPLGSLEEARGRLGDTEEMRALLKHARVPLAGLRDLVGELDRAAGQGRPAEPEALYRVVELLRAGLTAREVLTSSPSALPRLHAMGSSIEDLPDLREEIPAKVDPRGEVRDDATPRLAEVRRLVAELRASLRARAQRILNDPKLRSAFQSEGVTIKDDRYLLPVKAEYRSWVHGPIRDRSQSGSTLYVEPDAITLDGDRLLEALDAERDEVQRILWELTRKVLAARPALARIQERLARVDFTCAKARYAEAFGLCAPLLDDSGVLDLRDARHPYLLWLSRDLSRGHDDVDLEAACAKVVPISVRLGETFRVLVVTGPNTGGKTVALKTIGLNVLLASSGVPVAAAEGSRVPLYARVFADIGDEQSIEQSLSTFSSHLTNILEVLREAGPGSLVLLDELGAGTDPLEGAALGRALLDKFLEKGWSAVITTHIGSLKEYAYSRDGVENAAMEFDPRTLKPTYRLLMGIPGSSNALAIARRIGLAPDVVEAAEREIAEIKEPTRDIIQRMELSRRRTERERRRAERLRRRAQGEARAYEERRREVEVEREAMLREAQQVVDESVRQARERLLELVGGLKSLPKTHQPIADTLREEVDRLLVATPLGMKREEFARSLKKEDDVYVPKFRAKAKVKKVDKGGRLLTVLMNGILTEIGFDDVSWLEGPGGGS
ncbi:MAG: endonuclease MutS2 [Planctomycetes bacterium]|nr:endonuclease MutS2 [Planctomycetota bacterium]